MKKINFRYVLLWVHGVSLGGALCWANVPIAQLKGVDELFSKHYKLYSPLTGLLHHNTTTLREFSIPSQSALSKTMASLFVKTPSGEITATHIHSNPAGNLSGSTIARILSEFDQIKKVEPLARPTVASLQQALIKTIWTDTGYLENLNHAKTVSLEIKNEINQLETVWKTQNLKAELAEQFRKETVIPVYLEYRNLKAKIKKLNQENSPELIALQNKNDELQTQYESMKTDYVTITEKKTLLRKLRHELENHSVDSKLYQQRLIEFTEALAASFLDNDLTTDSGKKNHFGTITALLSYLWMKYESKAQLREYLEEAFKVGFLNLEVWSQLKETFFTEYYTNDDYRNLINQFAGSWRPSHWVSEHFSDAIAISTDSITNVEEGINTFQNVPFSYAAWMAYHPLYADCTENAIHNIFGMIAFDPRLGRFNPEILSQLKQQYYPKLDQRVIEYYTTYQTLEQHNRGEAKKRWIDLLVGLNSGYENLPKDQKIHYMRSKSELASDLANIIKVINRLMGIEKWSQDNLVEIFSKVKAISGMDVLYTVKSNDKEKIDRAEFKVGRNIFTLTSYGRFHCIFKRRDNPAVDTAQRVYKILIEKLEKQEKEEIKQFRYKAAEEYLKYFHKFEDRDELPSA